MTKPQPASTPSRVNLVMALLPLLLLVALVAAFLWLNPLAFFTGAFPPLEELSIQQVRFPTEGQIELHVINGGPDPVTIAQVLVDDAYWQFTIEPGNTLDRLGRATIALAYPWVKDEPLPITLVTSTGTTFAAAANVAVESPHIDSRTFLAYGLLGFYVGVVPVTLGMLWYPFMRRINRKWMNAILALTVGLLVFLFVDTLLEAVELAAEVPGVFQGVPLVFLVTLLTLGVLLAVGQRQGPTSPLRVATLIALGIGLHNLGEGLAIGAAFATGAAALGSFLVVGFTLHNITEGVGIVAPLLRGEQPKLKTFIGLALLAGGPAILGTWIGSLAFSPFLATLFLSIGAGAILQVIWEVGKLLTHEAQRQKESALSWLNFGGLAAGILIMYLTAFLVN
ncbi:MAG: ZIP family metal transporter [Chloroflexi bacterium]|nr:ZIP family metal transporter [Chloroflexota bacterium]MBP8059228.1 ZIP family metal transporter [Chloroflexota bacterium]